MSLNVGVTGLEPAASCSQSRCATNCATPRLPVHDANPERPGATHDTPRLDQAHRRDGPTSSPGILARGERSHFPPSSQVSVPTSVVWSDDWTRNWSRWGVRKPRWGVDRPRWGVGTGLHGSTRVGTGWLGDGSVPGVSVKRTKRSRWKSPPTTISCPYEDHR